MRMPKKPETKIDTWRRYVGLGIVFLIVVGVAGLAFASSQLKPTVIDQQPPLVSQPASQGRGPAFLHLDGSRILLIESTGSRTREIKWPDDISRLGTPLSQISGVDLQSGQTVWLDPEFKKSPANIFRSPDGRRDVSSANERPDGSNAVQIKQGNDVSTLVLRQKNGRQIIDSQLLGWLDNDKIALAGLATSTKAIFCLGLDGNLDLLAFLPDDAWLMRIFEGSIYYLRAAVGEGIESPQQAPSSIWRISKNGLSEKLADEATGVVQSFAVASSTVFYAMDDQALKTSENGSAKNFSHGRALMGVPGGVVVSNDGKISLIKMNGQTSILNLEPKGMLFYLPQADLSEEL